MRMRFLATVLLAIGVAGCSAANTEAVPVAGYVLAPDAPSLVDISHLASADLVRGLSREDCGPILMTSLVSLHDLKRSSGLGRIVSEMVATGVTARGYSVVEARLTKALTISSAGEHILSSEVRELARAQKATAVIAGTYGILGDRAYVTVRLIRLSDGVIISSSDFDLPLVWQGS